MHRYRSPSPHTHHQDHPVPMQDRPSDGHRYPPPATDRWRPDEPHSSRASHSRHPPTYHDRVDSARYPSSRSQNYDPEYQRNSASSSRDTRSHHWSRNEQNRDSNHTYKTEKPRHSHTRSQQQQQHPPRGEQSHWQSHASERASWDRDPPVDETRVLERSSWDRDPKDDPPRPNDFPRSSSSYIQPDHTDKWKKKNPNNRQTNRNDFQKRPDAFKAARPSRSRSRSPSQPRGRSASRSSRSSPSPSPPKKAIHRLPVAGKRKRSSSPPSPVSATRPKPPPAEVLATPDVLPTARPVQRSGSALVRQFFPGDDDEDVEMPPPAAPPPVLPPQKEIYPPRDDPSPPPQDLTEHRDSFSSGRRPAEYPRDQRSDSYRDRSSTYRDNRPGHNTGRYHNVNDRRGDHAYNSPQHRRRQIFDDQRHPATAPDERQFPVDNRRHPGGYDNPQGGTSRMPQPRFNDRPREAHGDERHRRTDDQVEDRTFYPVGDRRAYRRHAPYDNSGGGGRHLDVQREEYNHSRSDHTSPALSHNPSPPSTPRDPPFPPGPTHGPPRDFIPNEYHRDSRMVIGPLFAGGLLPRSHRIPDGSPADLDTRPTQDLIPAEEATPPIPSPATHPPIQTAPPPPSPSGNTDMYQIVNQVGEGTFGKVYRAYNHVTQLYVALKRIRMEAEKDGFPVTAMREIKLLQSLRHPNVVQLYEMMIDRGNVHMVFEYVSHDLVGLLSQPQFKLTPSHLKSLCRQMLSGLAYLHHKAVIHRDMKASNLLVSSSGDLKIADFGLARFYQKRRQLDYTNRIITLWYRPPELLLGTTVYGPEVDMWSAGCIFIELFVTKPIFQGNDELHQLDVLYGLLGTPDAECLRSLPWYELVKPKRTYKCQFRETFKKWLPDDALDLAQALLNYDFRTRVSAQQALEAEYFRNEPAAVAPNLSSLQGDWHEYEYKLAKKRRMAEEADSAPATMQ